MLASNRVEYDLLSLGVHGHELEVSLKKKQMKNLFLKLTSHYSFFITDIANIAF